MLKLGLRVTGLLFVALITLLLWRSLSAHGYQPHTGALPGQQTLTSSHIERLQQVLRIPTVSGQDPAVTAQLFSQLHATLQTQFPLVFTHLQQQVFGAGTLLLTWQGSASGAPVLLMNHLDVVPVEDESRWQQPPFSGALINGEIWGRGALDTKGAALATLEAVEALLAQGMAPQRTLYFLFGHDEEVGGLEGDAAVAEYFRQQGIRLDYVIDEGGLIVSGMMPGIDKPMALIGLSERGYLSLALTSEGEDGHSSIPPLETAVDRMSRALVRLHENPFPASLGGVVGLQFEFMAPESAWPYRLVYQNQWLFEPLALQVMLRSKTTASLVRTSQVVTLLNAGVQDNVIPAQVRAVLNCRLVPGDGMEWARQRVQNLVAQDGVTVEIYGESNSNAPPVASLQGEGFRQLQQALHEVWGQDLVVAPSLSVAQTDSRYFVDLADNVYRFTPIELTPQTVSTIHGANERIALENYRRMLRFYDRLVRNLLAN